MKPVLRLIAFLLFACSAAFSQTVISSVYVSASTATTATIVWTTNTAATSLVRYGNTTALPYSNNVDTNKVTSHSMTLTNLNAAQPWYFAVVSTDNSGIPTQSSTVQFSLCGTPLIPVTGTVNFAYGNGTYTLTWSPPSGAVGSPTVCGQPVTQTVTGTLNTSGSFSAVVADALKVTPGPGTWNVSVVGAGSIGSLTVQAPLSAVSPDVTGQLQTAAAPVGLTTVTATASTCNPSWVCASSGSVVNPGANYAIPQYSLTSGKVLGPSNITVDAATGSNMLIPGTLTISALTAGNCLQAGTAGLLGTTAGPCGVGSVSGLTSAFIPLATGTAAITKSSPLSVDDVNTPTKVTSSVNTFVPGSIIANTPHSDIRSFGAVIDGATPIDTALAAAAVQAGTSSGVVLLPCMGSGCYLTNGTLPTVAGKTIQYKLQGTLFAGSTVIQNSQSPIICDGGTGALTYVPVGPNCTISSVGANGTLGTSTSAQTTATFTPVFIHGSMTNLPVGSAITVIDPITCNFTSIARTSATTQNVTATYTPPCRVPPGSLITIAGVTDSTFNGTAMVLSNDYVAGTITWHQPGQSPSTSSGGSMTGQDDDTFESCTITAVTSTDATCYFNHAHSSSAYWGEVGFQTLKNSNTVHYMRGLFVRNAYGANIRLNRSSYGAMEGVSALPLGWPTSIAVEVASSYGWRISASDLLTVSQAFCQFNCTQPSYPMGLRITSIADPTVQDSSDLNWIIDGNTKIQGGIKIDTNGLSTPGSLNKIGDLRIRDTTIEQPVGTAMIIDPRFAAGVNRGFTFYNTILQDNFLGYPMCMVLYTDPSTSGMLAFNTLEATALQGCIVNSYYGGQLVVNGLDYTQGTVGLPRYGGNVGVLNDGRMMEGELRGEGASMSPSIIPFATSNVTVNPASWTCAGTGCVVNVIPGPDGLATSAGELVAGSAGNPNITVYSLTTATVTNDVILSGVWCRTGQNITSTSCMGESGIGHPYILLGTAPEVFDGINNNAVPSTYQSQWTNDWWHPIVSMNIVTTGYATPHGISMRLYGPSTTGQSVLYFQPFFIYVPYSSKPATWTDAQWFAEIARWRTQLLHGHVSPNMVAGALNIGSAYKMYWGSDTNLYRSSAGVLKTDGVFNAVGGLQINGIPITGAVPSGVPGWLQYLGDGSGGAVTCTTSIPNGFDNNFSSFTVNAGQTCKVAARGNVIRVTGACTINGTLDASAVGVGNTSIAQAGGSGGGGGGGTLAGTAGGASGYGSIASPTQGTAGATSGGNGGNGNPVGANAILSYAASGITADYAWGGGGGGAGGSSGGAAGAGGEFVILACGSITGTGTIRADGGYGSPSTANSTGAGGGGAGGVIITRSPADTSTLTLITNGGPGGSNVVPMAQWYGGGNSGLTTTTTVSAGAITAISVGGTLTNWLAAPNCVILGGGGSGATCHFTTSGSSPTLTITGAVVDAGGSGYTASTWTTSGTGGKGGDGWNKRYPQ
jgi:hypothetical protein